MDGALLRNGDRLIDDLLMRVAYEIVPRDDAREKYAID